MKKQIITLFIVGMFLFCLIFLPSCKMGTPQVMYKGVLENVSIVKNETTITFTDKTAVTFNYNGNWGDGVLIYGETYNLMRIDSCGEIIVYLVKVQ